MLVVGMMVVIDGGYGDGRTAVLLVVVGNGYDGSDGWWLW